MIVDGMQLGRMPVRGHGIHQALNIKTSSAQFSVLKRAATRYYIYISADRDLIATVAPNV